MRALPRPAATDEAFFGVDLTIEVERGLTDVAGAELQHQRKVVAGALAIQRELSSSLVGVIRIFWRRAGTDHAARKEGQAALDHEPRLSCRSRFSLEETFPTILTFRQNGAFWFRAPFRGGLGRAVVGHIGAPRRIEQPTAPRSSRRPCVASPRLPPESFFASHFGEIEAELTRAS